MIKLAVATFATKNYCYACEAQAPLLVASLRYAEVCPSEVLFIFVGDGSKEATTAFTGYEKRLKIMGVSSERITLDVACNANGKHAKASNLVIARMQNAAFDLARCHGAAAFWSLEADILPQPNALRTLMDTLAFDRGWYDVAMATYPNEEFLGGHGDPRNWIAPNVTSEEKEVAPDLAAWLAYRDRRRMAGVQPDAKEAAEWAQMDRDLEASPPKGNVFQLNAAGYKRRGWLPHAYPGIGLGSIVPVEWVGVGCTLLSERALNLANFTGYDGGCTQDLWLCWRAWHTAGLRIATATHAVCSHVKIREIKETEAKNGETKDKITKQPFIHHAHHELSGVRQGHLNNDTRPWEGL